MADISNIVRQEISSLEKQGKLSEMQCKFLMSLILQDCTYEKLSKMNCEEQIRIEISKIIQGVSFNLSIPTKSTSEDISSPLDTFLLAQKKHANGNFSVENTMILKQLENEIDL